MVNVPGLPAVPNIPTPTAATATVGKTLYGLSNISVDGNVRAATGVTTTIATVDGRTLNFMNGHLVNADGGGFNAAHVSALAKEINEISDCATLEKIAIAIAADFAAAQLAAAETQASLALQQAAQEAGAAIAALAGVGPSAGWGGLIAQLGIMFETYGPAVRSIAQAAAQAAAMAAAAAELVSAVNNAKSKLNC